MPTLYVLDGPDLGKQAQVDDGAVLGRNPDCTVRVRHRSVSRRHARIEREGERWFVVDLGSRNGVYVAGERVERHALTDGMELRLGEVPLRVRLEEPAAADAPPHAEETLLDEQEIELEEEIELEPDAEGEREQRTAPPPPEPAPSAPPVSAPAERPAAAAAPPPSPALSEREERRARVLGQMQRQSAGGLFSGDLSQQPLWVRALVYAIALLVLAAAFLGVFVGMRAMRGG